MHAVKTLHTVKIRPATEDELMRVEFTCHGDGSSECHQYPDCDCETWEKDGHEHPFSSHAECWMRPWFDNDCTDPYFETLMDCGYMPGMQGEIETTFHADYIEWEFVGVHNNQKETDES